VIAVFSIRPVEYRAGMVISFPARPAIAKSGDVEVKNAAELTAALDAFAAPYRGQVDGQVYIATIGRKVRNLDAVKTDFSRLYLYKDAAIENEKDVAQWYTVVGQYEAKAILATLPDDVQKQCYQYGGLRAWRDLPIEAKKATQARMMAVRAEGEAMAARIDSARLTNNT